MYIGQWKKENKQYFRLSTSSACPQGSIINDGRIYHARIFIDITRIYKKH